MTVAQAKAAQYGADSIPRKWVAVTFDTAPTFDSATAVFRGIYNGASSAKDIAVTDLDGDSITIANVPSGHIVPGPFQKVNTTNTTALAAELRGII